MATPAQFDEEQTAIVWDARSGAMIQSLTGHMKKVTTTALSPDGGRLVTEEQTGR